MTDNGEDGPKQEVCANCAFWKQRTELIGECRNGPPVVIIDGQFQWPIVGAKQWCGCWRWAVQDHRSTRILRSYDR